MRLPSAPQSAERDRFVEQAVASKGARASYGAWVYFPWEAKLVHLLEPDDYFEVITTVREALRAAPGGSTPVPESLVATKEATA